MQFLIVGTGGVGGALAGFLAKGGQDVACIARGEHLKVIREQGLRLQSDLLGDDVYRIPSYDAEEYEGKADVIFLCVKGYGVAEVVSLLERASHEGTLIIPLLNGFGIGNSLSEQLPQCRVADGCVYISSYIQEYGKIRHEGKFFRIVWGSRITQPLEKKLLSDISERLTHCGIKVEVSNDIRRDTFIKWAFISAMACTGAYYDVPMGAVQVAGEAHTLFEGLSAESGALARAMGIVLPQDTVEYNLSLLSKMDAGTTASMQKDLAAGKPAELQSLLFDMIERGKAHHVPMPYYEQVAQRFAR